MIQQIHSYWAYIVLIVLIAAFINAVLGFVKKRSYKDLDMRLSRFTLIIMHFQLIFGFGVYFVSTYYKSAKEIGMGAAMKDKTTRLFIMEHPLMMVLAIVLVTVGFVKHKKLPESASRLKTIAIYYGIALLLVLSRLPWSQWFD